VVENLSPVVETATQQTASPHIQPAGGGSGVAVPRRPKVPAGISDVGTKPHAPAPSGPVAAPVGAEPRLSSRTLQLEAQAGNVTAGSAPHTTLFAGQDQPPQATPEVVSPADRVKAIVKEALLQRDYRTALSKAYVKATPEEQELMWKNTDVRAVIAEIVRPATAVLTN